MQWCINFPKIYTTPHHSSHQKSDMKKIPYLGPKYTRPHGTNILGPTVQNLDSQATWRMGYIGPFL